MPLRHRPTRTRGTPVAEEPVLTGTPTEPADEQTDHDLVARGRTEIIEIEKYYDRAAANAARFLYFWGMLAGARCRNGGRCPRRADPG